MRKYFFLFSLNTLAKLFITSSLHPNTYFKKGTATPLPDRLVSREISCPFPAIILKQLPPKSQQVCGFKKGLRKTWGLTLTSFISLIQITHTSSWKLSKCGEQNPQQRQTDKFPHGAKVTPVTRAGDTLLVSTLAMSVNFRKSKKQIYHLEANTLPHTSCLDYGNLKPPTLKMLTILHIIYNICNLSTIATWWCNV